MTKLIVNLRTLVAATMLLLSGAVVLAQDGAGLSIEIESNQSVTVGNALSFRVTATDTTSGEVPALLSNNLPAGASLDDNGDGTRQFNWIPEPGTDGQYDVRFEAVSASNSAARTERVVSISVSSSSSSDGSDGGLINPAPGNTTPGNADPVTAGDEAGDFYIEPLSAQIVTANNALVLRVTPRRTDRLVPDLHVQPMPANSQFNDNGDGTRTLIWRPESGDEGTYDLTFVATNPNDPGDSVSRGIQVTVLPDGSGALPEVPADVPDSVEMADTPDDIEMPDEIELPDVAERPDSSDVDGRREAFVQQLLGSQMDECRETVPGEQTERYVETFTDEFYVTEIYAFDNLDCSGVPSSGLAEALLYEYRIGNPVITDDGREAWELDLTVAQDARVVTTTFGAVVGAESYDIVTVERGQHIVAVNVASETPETRPTMLAEFNDAVINRPIYGIPLSQSDILGTWVSNCVSNRRDTLVFAEDSMLQTTEVFSDANCSETRYYELQIPWSAEYVGADTTVFGDPGYRVTIQAGPTSTINAVLDSNTPPPPSLTDEGTRFRDFYAVVDGQLIYGTCLDKRPGNCAQQDDNLPDMLNFPIPRRFTKQ